MCNFKVDPFTTDTTGKVSVRVWGLDSSNKPKLILLMGVQEDCFLCQEYVSIWKGFSIVLLKVF